MEKYCNAFNIEKIDNTNFDHVWIFLMIVKKKEGDNDTSIIKFSLKQLFDDMDRFKKYQSYNKKARSIMKSKTTKEAYEE